MTENDDAQTFKPGDVVRLKSGGPKMIVINTDGDKVWIAWLEAEIKTVDWNYVSPSLLVKEPSDTDDKEPVE